MLGGGGTEGLLAAHKGVRAVSETGGQAQPHWASKPTGSVFRITVAWARGRQDPGVLCFKVSPSGEKHCSRDVTSEKSRGRERFPRSHWGDDVSLQILSMERASVLSKVHQEPRRRTSEVEWCGSPFLPTRCQAHAWWRGCRSDGTYLVYLEPGSRWGWNPRIQCWPWGRRTRCSARCEGQQGGGKSLLRGLRRRQRLQLGEPP